MANVGFATLQVIPSLRGMEGQLSGQLGGSMGRIGGRIGAQLGGEASKGLISSIIGGLDDLGGEITRRLSTIAKVGAAAIAGLGGAALVGGAGRLMDTEDARVQMQRMGLSIAEVDGLLAGVDRTFDGTPFANPDGFNISSQLYASGVALEAIPDVLGTIADFSAHAGVDLQRMGGYFTQIATEGRVTGTMLNQMAQAGIPISVLADQLGVTGDELREMAAAGELTADVFFAAAGDIEMFQGAALAMGNTTRGAFQNVRNALSRLGEAFLSPLFGESGPMVTMFQAMRDALRDLVPSVEALGQAFADRLVPRMERFSAWMTSGGINDSFGRLADELATIREFFDRNSETIGRLRDAMSPMVGITAALAVAVNFAGRALVFLRRFTPVGIIFTLGTALIYAWQNSERFREVVTNAFEAVRDVVGPIADQIGGWVTGLFGGDAGAGEGIAGAFERIRQVAAETWPEVQRLAGEAMDWMRVNILPSLKPIADGISDAFGRIGKFMDNIDWDSVRASIKGFVVWLETYVAPALGAFFQAIASYAEVWSKGVQGIVTGVSWVWDKFGDHIMTSVEVAFGFVRLYVENVLSGVRAAFEVFSALLGGEWGRAWQVFADHIGESMGRIRDAAKLAVVFLADAWGGIIDWLSDNVPGVAKVFGALGAVFDAVRIAAVAVYDWIVGTLIPFFKGPFSTGLGTASAAVDGLLAPWDTFRARLGVIRTWLGGPFKRVFDDHLPTALSVAGAAVDVLRETWNTLRARLGGIRIWLGGTFQKLFDEHFPNALGAAGAAVDALRETWNTLRSRLGAIRDWMSISLVLFLEGRFVAALNGVGAAVDALREAWNTLRTRLSAVRDWMSISLVPFLEGRFVDAFNTAKSGVDGIKGAIDAVVTALRRLRDWISSNASGMFGPLASAVSAIISAIDGITSAARTALNAVDVLTGADSTRDARPGVFRLPPPPNPERNRHGGGMIPGNPNQDSLWWLKGGEAVFTRGQQMALGAAIAHAGGVARADSGDHTELTVNNYHRPLTPADIAAGLRMARMGLGS